MKKIYILATLASLSSAVFATAGALENITIVNDAENGSSVTFTAGGVAISEASARLTFLNEAAIADRSATEIFTMLNDLGEKLLSPTGSDGSFYDNSNFTQSFNAGTPAFNNTDKMFLAVGNANNFAESTHFTLLKFGSPGSPETGLDYETIGAAIESVFELYLVSPASSADSGWQVMSAISSKFGEIVWTNNTGTFELIAVPEPSLFGAFAGTLAIALAGTRRRRK